MMSTNDTDRSPATYADRMETWKSVTKSTLYLKRIGEFGKHEKEKILPGRVFKLLPSERRLNQTDCAKKEYDPFTNGMLQVIELVEGEHDNEALLGNPNIVEDDDVSKIFALEGEKFELRLARITAKATLQRLLEAAESEEIAASVPQLRMVRERLEEVDPGIRHVRAAIDADLREGKSGPPVNEDHFVPVSLSN